MKKRTAEWRQIPALVAVVVLRVLVDAWALMVVVGTAHHHWWSSVPTIAYTTALAVAATLAAARGFRGAAKYLIETEEEES